VFLQWSFGCVLWEIFSRCQSQGPWFAESPGETHLQRGANWVRTAKELIPSDARLARPDECPDEWWALISRCMSHDIGDRPTFEYVNRKIRSGFAPTPDPASPESDRSPSPPPEPASDGKREYD
jgi:Protein tyrosine and serine/threonine kinase